ncbi:MAG: hypothetical protein IJQ66_04015 [Clostridia bacterium]|nr:hypothetical protein [Clostridia bacterium]
MKIRFKNRLLKTCVSFALCLALFLPAGLQNGGTAKADVEHVIRDYSSLTDTDRFMIGGFYGADVTTDAGVTLLKNSGLDFTTMYGNHFEEITSLYFSTGNTSVIEAIYDRLHAAGLKIMIEGGRGTQPAATGMTGVQNVSGIPYDYSNISPTATTYGAWSEIGMGLSYDDVVIGSQLWDEPFDSEIDVMDEYLARYESAFPDKLFFVNLFARESINIGSFDLNGDGYADSRDYVYYVKHYANNVVDNMTNDNIKMISTDPYPFNRVNTDSPSYYYINPYYFTTLATSAIEAKEHGASLSYYVQTMDCSQESQPYKNSRDVKGLADITMQYNVAMAFGAKQIVNFCYETPDVSDPFMSQALVTAAGVPTTRYTCVQNAAYKAHSIGQAFMRFNWNGTVIAKGTQKDRFSTTYNRVGSSTFNCYADLDGTIYGGNYYYKSLIPYASDYNSNATTRTTLSGNNLLNVASSQTAMVGCFTDDAGYNGYMLASGDDAISNTATAMALTFDSSTEKVRIFNGVQNATNGNKEYYDVDLTDHTLNISLGAGEGVFVVPFKATEVKNVNLVVEGTSNEVVKVEDGGNYVLEDRLSGIDADKAIVGYLYGGNLYPIGYTIENITSDITLTAVYIDLKMEYGASVRMNTDKEHAIRWRAFLDKDDYAAIGSSYNVVGYGFTVMSPDRKGSLTIEVASGAFRDFGEEYRLAGVLTHLSDEELCEEFEARAFVKIRFADGQIKKVHARGNDNLRSIAYVASAAYNDSTASWSAVQMERLRLLAASYEQNDNIGSLDNWLAQVDVDNLGSLDYWLRLIALYG